MSRQFFEVEKGYGIAQENGNTLVQFLSGTASPDGLGDQANAPIGSLYIRSGTGELYQKIANAGASADWEIKQSGQQVVSRWRDEKVDLQTGDTLSAGTFDVTTLTDLESTLTASDITVGNYIIGALGLWEITNVSFPNVTIAAAANAPVQGDAFIVRKYLIDSPSSQELQAGVLFDTTQWIKLFDVNFTNQISSGYTPNNGSIATGDLYEEAFEKLDGNQQDLQTLQGVSQGSTDMGSFSGSTLSDGQNQKQLFQEVENNLEANRADIDDLRTLSGTADGETDHGLMDQGEILSDNETTNALFKETDAELTKQRGKSSVSGVTTISDVDTVLVQEVYACSWQVVVENAASPSNRRAFEIFAAHNATAVSSASAVDDTVSKILKLGSNFNYSISVDINGAGATQEMRLRVSSTEPSGVNVYTKRIETLS
jgi:hypothetical protein